MSILTMSVSLQAGAAGVNPYLHVTVTSFRATLALASLARPG